MDSEPVTLLLQRMGRGDRGAAEELFGILYDELRRRAAGIMSGQAGQTLQPTAVVHEAWLKLGEGDWESRGHFLGVAAKAMRSVLVDHARARRAEKRSGGGSRVGLDQVLLAYEERALDLVGLDEALGRLEAFDPELARLVELRFFGGLSIAETAEVLGRSTATIERSWRTARSFLRVELGDEADGSS